MTAAEIAARLTDAQRRALLWLLPDTAMARTTPGKLIHSLYSLEQKGLAWSFSYSDWWRISAAGAEVRAILAAEAQRDG